MDSGAQLGDLVFGPLPKNSKEKQRMPTLIRQFEKLFSTVKLVRLVRLLTLQLKKLKMMRG